MSPSLFSYLLLNVFISVLVGGIIFIRLGYKFHRKLALIRTGWIILGVLSIVVTAGLVYLSFMTGMMIVFTIFLVPLLILVGLILTLTFGISDLAIGFSKPRNPKKIANGFIFIGINLAVVTTLVVLLVMFTTGIIPIRLM